MSLRPKTFSIPSTTELKVTFTDSVYELVSAENFKVESLNGSVSDLEVIGVTIDNDIVTVKTRPQVSGNYYILKFLDTEAIPFKSVKGESIPFDSVSRELFFVGIDSVNPIRDNMFELIPGMFGIENTNLKNIISAQAEEIYRAQKKIGQVLSNNYLSVDVVDELVTRNAGATDRLANENAFEIYRVSKLPTNADPKQDVLDYTMDNTFERNKKFPVYPISLQQDVVEEEVIDISTSNNSFKGYLLTLSKKNIIKVLSVRFIASGQEEDCFGNLGVEYDIEKYKYTLKDNFYDQDYAFKFSLLEDNQVLLSEFGNIPYPSVLDKFIVSYLYKNTGRRVLEDEVVVSRVEYAINESIPANSSSFFLRHAPIVGSSNQDISYGGVQFKISENIAGQPAPFLNELVYDAGALPSRPGEYAINYSTGEVIIYGADSTAKGTGFDNIFATYYYRKQFVKDLDYSIFNQNLVSNPNRDLSGYEAQVDISYEEVFIDGDDYIAKSHIEVMPEFVENRLSQSFKIKTKNQPITDVFRILNQTTGEVYNYLYSTNTEISFSGSRSPEIRDVISEEANFYNSENEVLSVVGEFVVPAFRVSITANAVNTFIQFSPGIPAELIDPDSDNYFFRQTNSDSSVKDINIVYFNSPNLTTNLITSAAINPTSPIPSLFSEFIIGTKAYIVNLENERIINNNKDSIGSLTNSSLNFSSDLFLNEKWFRSLNIIPSAKDTNLGGLSKTFTEPRGSEFYENLSRLRKVGDYSVDYQNGVIYIAIAKDQNIDIGNASYHYGDIDTLNKNILTSSGAFKKKNSSDSLDVAEIIYSNLSNDNDKIVIYDLDNTLSYYDGITSAPDSEGTVRIAFEVLEDYTAVVPHKITSINTINNLLDLSGYGLGSTLQADRLPEYTPEELRTPTDSGGRNIYNSNSVYFSGNVIDFKKRATKALGLDEDVPPGDPDYFKVVFQDPAATQFYALNSKRGNSLIFDQSLNIKKISDVEVANVSIDISGTFAILSISSDLDFESIVLGTDKFLDPDGNRFAITAVDPDYSLITVDIPIGETFPEEINIKCNIVNVAEVTVSGGEITIRFPLSSGLYPDQLVEVSYITEDIPEVGMPLAIDYRFGFIFINYSYVYDQIAVWYEYGDNELDWSISSNLEEGEEYYVSYRYGALREALATNFGSLTNIPFFNAFGINTNRELYRDAIQGTLQTFPKGPTNSSYKELIKSFTKIEPDITELAFGNWILGRDYLSLIKPEYTGILQFSPVKFGEGLVFNDDVSVRIPAISSLPLDEGTLDAWIRPSWGGVDNDATLTFNLKNIGKDKFELRGGADPFSSENGWSIPPFENVVGGLDHTGNNIFIYNYKSDSSEEYGLNQGVFGLYRHKDNFDKILNSRTTASFRISMAGFKFNDLRKEVVDLEESELGGFYVGGSGAGDVVGADSEDSLSNTCYLATMLVADGQKTVGLSLTLKDVEDFTFPIDTVISPNIESIDSDLLPDFEGPYYTRSCKCTVLDFKPKLNKFNDLNIDIELSSTFDMLPFKNSLERISDGPESFIVTDGEGVLYQVISFITSDSKVFKNSIPNQVKIIRVKKFGLNNPAISTYSADDINDVIPVGFIRLMYKGCEIITAPNYSDSTNFLEFNKNFLLNWSNFQKFYITRKPRDNEVIIKINNAITKHYYTDAIDTEDLIQATPGVCLNLDLSIPSSNFRGNFIGSLGRNCISNIELNRIEGYIQNFFDASDIHIGAEGWSPRESRFSLNRKEFSKSPLGQPPNSDSESGIYIWYDDLCRSPINEDIGQWIFRARYDRQILFPVGVTGGETDKELELFNYTFEGEINTNGEFSSVSRAYRGEDGLGCEDGVTCESSFRYCGNELIEEVGWLKIDDSDSEVINEEVGGRETQSSAWIKNGDFETSEYEGVYTMTSEDAFNQIDYDSIGNAIYTRIPCPDGYIEYSVSLRVDSYDPGIVGQPLGFFSGVIDGYYSGIVPIGIVDSDVYAKVAFGYKANGRKVILLLDGKDNSVIDSANFDWGTFSFKTYTLIKSKELENVTVKVDGVIYLQKGFSAFGNVTPNSYLLERTPSVALYPFDGTLMNISDYHADYGVNQISVTLVKFYGKNEVGVSQLESEDFIINTDSSVEFSIKVNGQDDTNQGVDEIFLTSDRVRYLVDTGIDLDRGRFSIFKDGKGFLNFRIIDNKPEPEIFNLATNIKNFKPGELHHIAASWKLNTIDSADEMHLFLDGLEAPNIYKFGGKIPVRINDKFRDISKEVIHDFTTRDIEFYPTYDDGSVSSGDVIFTSAQANFTADMVGRSILITSSSLADKEYIITSFIDSDQITLGSGNPIRTMIFDSTISGIKFKFPPTTFSTLTDLRNSKFSVYRTKANGAEEEMAGILYRVESGTINVYRGSNVIRPKFRANMDTRIIEFIGQNDDCEYVQTVLRGDLNVHLRTYGLNMENVKYKANIHSSSYYRDDPASPFYSSSIFKNKEVEPASLEDVEITRLILDGYIVNIAETDTDSTAFEVKFDDFDPIGYEKGFYMLTSEQGESPFTLTNKGRILTISFNSDNLDFSTYRDGLALSYITIHGVAQDSVGAPQTSETIEIFKNGEYNTQYYFKSIEKITGKIYFIDKDYSEAAVITLRERDSIFVSNNSGISAEIFDYINDYMILAWFNSYGSVPFELNPGWYIVEFPANLRVEFSEVGHDLYIGSSLDNSNKFGGAIDQLRIVSELSSDTRPTEIYTGGTRSVTEEFGKTVPACPDNQTLTLIPFNNPSDLQLRKLRTIRFLDTVNNVSYGLEDDERLVLSEYLNDEFKFVSQMIQWGYSEEDSVKTYHEVHKAGGGPIFNIADFYRNVEEFPRSNKSVNNYFGNSGNFTYGKGLLFVNNDNKLSKNEGTIEFWVSPNIDVTNDKEIRYLFDAYSGSTVRVTSRTSRLVELSNPAARIISVKLLNKKKEYSELYSVEESGSIIFDEISRATVSGVLEGGTGSDKDFSLGSTLSPDGLKIYLSESLPAENIDVVVTYLPTSATGDRLSIFKDPNSQLSFRIIAGGIENIVVANIEWKKNSWNRVVCYYKANSDFDTMRIYTNGDQGGQIRYGTYIPYGDGSVYNQFTQGDGQSRTYDYNLKISSDLKLFCIGSDIFGTGNCKSRIDNFRISNIIRKQISTPSGSIDPNYSANLNTVYPVVKDNSTTLLLDFDSDYKKIEKFATVIDPKRGIYNFDIDVFDNFDRVINVNNGEVEDLIVELVNRLKPAHTDALVKFIKSRC